MNNSNCCDANIVNGVCADCKEHCISVREEYEKNVENLIRKSMGKDIEIKMLDKECEGMIINKEVVLEILKELTE